MTAAIVERVPSRPSGIPRQGNFLTEHVEFFFTATTAAGKVLHGEVSSDPGYNSPFGPLVAITIRYPSGAEPECGQPGIVGERRADAVAWLEGDGLGTWLETLRMARAIGGAG